MVPPLQVTPRFRTALPADLEAIVELRARVATDSPEVPFTSAREGEPLKSSLRGFILDRCVLLGEINGTPFFAAALDLDCREVSELYFDEREASDHWITRCITAIERLAIGFGILSLGFSVAPCAQARFLSAGYRAGDSRAHGTGLVAASAASLNRSLRRRLDRYGRLILEVFGELGIPGDYGSRHRLARQPEVRELRSIGLDIHGREQFMSPRAGAAWQRLRQRALRDGVELQAVSAFRSVAYQVELLRRKMARGLPMEAILRVSAAPGFSEHHSGNAIDITTPGFAPLEEEFELSPAFRWLEGHAPKLGFRLSFPRENRHQVSFEPWHWFFSPEGVLLPGRG